MAWTLSVTGTIASVQQRKRRQLAVATLCLCVPGLAGRASAATPAGAAIINSATLRWSDAQPQSTVSNTVTLITAEVLDVTIAADRATIAVATPDVLAAGFVVTNTGNGQEDFALTVASDRAGVDVTRVAVDTDGDGRYDPAKDRALSNATLALAPGQATRIFVLVDGAQVTDPARITARVEAKTGSGASGSVFPGAGDAGGDAVVGTTGAAANAVTTLTPATNLPALAKSQSVRAPDGSARGVRGAVVTYRLVATFPAALPGAVVDDPIPAGTTYLPGSLSLDDRALSDAADTDAGTAGAAGVHVALGDIAAAGTRAIQFSVTIQ